MRKFELFLSYFSALLCATLTIGLWAWISTFQTLWPFPALYLLELMALALAASYFSIRDLPHAAVFNWAVAGVFFGFYILAGFTIGVFYLPFVILYALIGILSDRRRQQKKFWPHLGTLVIGSLLQAGLILLILQLHIPPPS